MAALALHADICPLSGPDGAPTGAKCAPVLGDGGPHGRLHGRLTTPVAFWRTLRLRCRIGATCPAERPKIARWRALALLNAVGPRGNRAGVASWRPPMRRSTGQRGGNGGPGKVMSLPVPHRPGLCFRPCMGKSRPKRARAPKNRNLANQVGRLDPRGHWRFARCLSLKALSRKDNFGWLWCRRTAPDLFRGCGRGHSRRWRPASCLRP